MDRWVCREQQKQVKRRRKENGCKLTEAYLSGDFVVWIRLFYLDSNSKYGSSVGLVDWLFLNIRVFIELRVLQNQSCGRITDTVGQRVSKLGSIGPYCECKGRISCNVLKSLAVECCDAGECTWYDELLRIGKYVDSKCVPFPDTSHTGSRYKEGQK